jgi:hypothetical protein
VSEDRALREAPVAEHADTAATAAPEAHADAAPAPSALARAGNWVLSKLAGAPPQQSPLPAKGEWGELTKELTINSQKIAAGTVIEVTAVDTGTRQLTCKLWSGHAGAPATIAAEMFRSEPQLSNKEEPGHTSEPEDYAYEPYDSILWDGAPKLADVAQGALGDCYLLASMGAVVAQDPSKISRLFSPTKSGQASYTVTLHLPTHDGKMEPHPVVIDSELPTKLADVQRRAPVYALMGKSTSDKKTPMWPALLEKAYAKLVGGYVVAGQGGSSAYAMSVITGVASEALSIPAKNDELLAKFKQLKKAGEAVTAATIDSLSSSGKSGFTLKDKSYHFAITNSDGEGSELVPSTLVVTDTKHKAPEARDGGDNKLTGAGVHGTCSYGWDAAVDLTYDEGKAPGAPEDLRADYQWRGQLDKSINLYANHVYTFDTVTDDNKLVFKNPWGEQHPKPMTPEDFRRLFGSLSANPITERKAHGK